MPLSPVTIITYPRLSDVQIEEIRDEYTRIRIRYEDGNWEGKWEGDSIGQLVEDVEGLLDQCQFLTQKVKDKNIKVKRLVEELKVKDKEMEGLKEELKKLQESMDKVPKVEDTSSGQKRRAASPESSSEISKRIRQD